MNSDAVSRAVNLVSEEDNPQFRNDLLCIGPTVSKERDFDVVHACIERAESHAADDAYKLRRAMNEQYNGGALVSEMRFIYPPVNFQFTMHAL
jgi:hypothetical protein